jgi:Stress responsive A/B Barrel Domain
MIRNVVLVKLKPDADPTAIARVQDGLRGLNRPGTLSYTLGDDLKLRDGNWDFAIVADFSDAQTYTAYDRDDEHNRLRAELAPHAEAVARVQFQLPG